MEFNRLDGDKSGGLDQEDLIAMTHPKLGKQQWDKIIEECAQNATGQIDFQEFLTASLNRKALTKQNNIKIAFTLLDVDGDGFITLEDMNDLFSSYGGIKIDDVAWGFITTEANC